MVARAIQFGLCLLVKDFSHSLHYFDGMELLRVFEVSIDVLGVLADLGGKCIKATDIADSNVCYKSSERSSGSFGSFVPSCGIVDKNRNT